MDEEDDPLLGKRLETADKYASIAPRKPLASAPTVLDELVSASSNYTIGRQLLSHMGWKEGHGIGPRIRRRKLSIGSPEEEEEVEEGTNKKEEEIVYLPPRNTVDRSAFPQPKTDTYGAGFDPFVDAPEFRDQRQRRADNKELIPTRQVVTFAQALGGGGGDNGGRGGGRGGERNSGRVAMGFGLSALEENDDIDVYDGSSSMDQYDRAIEPSTTSRVKQLDVVTSAERERQRREDALASAMRCADGRSALPKFRLATRQEKLVPKNVVNRLTVPSDFRAYHVFKDTEDGASALYRHFDFTTGKHGQSSMMTARQRAQVLEEEGDKPAVTNVFDMLSVEQHQRLEDAATATRERRPLIQGASSEQFRANITASIAKRFVSASSSTSEITSTSVSEPQPPQAKKAYRTESTWAPHTLLCKRFHVKCQGQTISGGGGGDEGVSEDLFTTELAPHLVQYAAEKRSGGGGEAEVNETKQKQRARAEEELPPLADVPKPSTALLRSIFEPSGEGEGEDKDESDDEEDSDEEEDKTDPGLTAPPPAPLSVDRVAEPTPRDPLPSSPSSSSGESESESNDDELCDRARVSENKSKRKREQSESRERSAKKHKKHAKKKKDKHKKDKDKKHKKSKHQKSSSSSSSSSRGRSDAPSSPAHARRRSHRSHSRSRARDRR